MRRWTITSQHTWRHFLMSFTAEPEHMAISKESTRRHILMSFIAELEHMASSEESTNDGSRDASPINESPRQSRKDIWTTRSEGQASQGYGTNDNDRGNNKYPGSSSYTPAMEDVLRRRLKYYFMDPCSKFRARRHWPWKLSVQILKIVLITFQVC